MLTSNAQMETERAARSGIHRGKRLLAKAADWNQLLRGEPCHAPFIKGKGRALCDGKRILLGQRLFGKSRQHHRLRRIAYSVFLRNDDDEATHRGEHDEDGRVVLLCEARGTGRRHQLTIEVVLSRAKRQAESLGDYAQADVNAAGSNALWLQ
ncbi:MAG: hypothetical protein JRH20_26770 [Deltaproteobacteria bacterium]|nr:hypothetical protein [Deltaproteobacteria bacterium]